MSVKTLNFNIIKLSICFVLGIVIGYFFSISITTTWIATGIGLFLFFIIWQLAKRYFKQNIWFGCTAFLFMVLTGILTVNFHKQNNFKDHYTQLSSSYTDSLTNITFKVREVLKPNNYYNKYIVETTNINGKNTCGKLLLNIKHDSLQPLLKVDAIAFCKTKLQPINPPLNPYQFNYKMYLERQYVYHQIIADNASLFRISEKTTSLFGLADKIRIHINKKLKTYHFTKEELAIINALFLGQRQYISEDTYTNYANAGAIHILAISGLHVGILLLILNFVFKPLEQLKHGNTIKTIVLLFILWSFAIIAGLSASVVRAVTMFSILAIAINLKRPTNIYNTLVLSLLILLLFKPLFLFDIGFQLSYLAVFAIVSIDPLLYKLWQPQYWLLDKLWHTFTVSLSAQLGVLPVSLFYFHQFPGLFFISNLIIIPVLGIILCFGIITIIASVLNIFSTLFSKTLALIIANMNGFIAWISSKEQFIFKDIPINIWQVISLYCIIVSSTILIKRKRHRHLKWFLMSVILCQITFIYTETNKPKNRLIIFNKSRFTLLGHVTQNKIIEADNFDSITRTNTTIIRNYCIGSHIKTVEKDILRPIYILGNKKLLVVDSFGIYNTKAFKPDFVLLIQSPKINLNRLIDSLNPKHIIADGSNYKSYIAHWQTICEKKKLPFYYTAEKGAFTIKY
ncbi:MAG: ComEC/Rec2 family competence protein [Aestuariibaculum sp.]